LHSWLIGWKKIDYKKCIPFLECSSLDNSFWNWSNSFNFLFSFDWYSKLFLILFKRLSLLISFYLFLSQFIVKIFIHLHLKFVLRNVWKNLVWQILIEFYNLFYLYMDFNLVYFSFVDWKYLLTVFLPKM